MVPKKFLKLDKITQWIETKVLALQPKSDISKILTISQEKSMRKKKQRYIYLFVYVYVEMHIYAS